MGVLGQLAPMPVKDECRPPSATLWLAYAKWPLRYGGSDSSMVNGGTAGVPAVASSVDDTTAGNSSVNNNISAAEETDTHRTTLIRGGIGNNNNNRTKKLLRGSKCPRFLDGGEGYIKQYSNLFPKTKFIIGIR